MPKGALLLMAALGAWSGCAGMKVVHPNEKNENAGTLALDTQSGQMRLVTTVTCKLEAMGKRFSAIGKTEEEGRKEVVARCREASVLSFCKPENVKCAKN